MIRISDSGIKISVSRSQHPTPASNSKGLQMDKEQFRILAVDDDTAILDLYTEILCDPPGLPDSVSSTPSFDLTFCGQAEAAVEAVRGAIKKSSRFSLVFMDVRLPPGPDGIWAAGQIRNIDPAVGIVLVTGHQDVDLNQIEHRIPPPDKLLYLDKPFSPKEILQIAISMCTKWERKKELRTIHAHLETRLEERTSALKAANKRLQGTEEGFRNMVVNNADGVIILDKNLIVKFMNPAAESLFRRKSEEMIGEPFGYPVVTEESTEIDIIRGNKDPVVAEMRLTKTEWNGEKAYIASLRDVTEQKGMREALQKSHDELELRVKERTAELAQANQTKSEFLTNMSHELRTPLNAIIGFSEILEDLTFGELNKKQMKYIKNIVESSHHLHQLINDILDLSKVEAGKIELEPSQVKINELLENSLIMIREKAAGLNIAVAVDSPVLPSGLEITADERKLKQIMYNLLSNAIKFTPDGGSVRINAEAIEAISSSSDSEIPNPQSAIEISVTDSGIGINPEDQARVFQEFEQLDSHYDRKYEGTGLGLALTRKLVKLHGGRIWVESEGEGKGSTFTFSIPLK